MRTLSEERDADAFEKMLKHVCSLSGPETENFIKHFIDNYGTNYHYWAYCHRLYSGLNTNMNLERL